MAKLFPDGASAKKNRFPRALFFTVNSVFLPQFFHALYMFGHIVHAGGGFDLDNHRLVAIFEEGVYFLCLLY
jgi:hypothetical protein